MSAQTSTVERNGRVFLETQGLTDTQKARLATFERTAQAYTQACMARQEEEAKEVLCAQRKSVRCSQCNTMIFDGLALKSRVIRVLVGLSQAKCHTCKNWVDVPLAYTG